MTMVHTAWETAETVHGTGDTVQHTDVGLFGANPAAFDHHRDVRRMNRLQQGQRVLNGISLVLCCIAGAALAFGMTARPEVLMSSGLICIVLLSLGGLLFHAAEVWFQSELVIDPDRQEIRILRLHPRGRREVVLKRGFRSLSGVAIGARDLTVVDQNGQRVARYRVPDREMLAELRHAVERHLPVLS